MNRHQTLTDRLINTLDQGLRVVASRNKANRSNPAENTAESTLDTAEKKHAAGLMRVNHTGEVCAQALYNGQLLTAKNNKTRVMLKHAAVEETDHLGWCEDRLEELGSHTSYANPLWYAGSYALGAMAGLAGDKISLGFVGETESQVEQHLASHLTKLPEGDLKSRAIVTQMQQDEMEHGSAAMAAGGQPLPKPIQWVMRATAKIMTTIAYRL